MSDQHATGWVCVDCLVWEANGEPAEMTEEEYDEWRSAIDRRVGDASVTLGLVAEEHDRDCPNVVDGEWNWVAECYCEQQEFSWSPCDMCGSTLGGSRDAVTFWFPAVAR